MYKIRENNISFSYSPISNVTPLHICFSQQPIANVGTSSSYVWNWLIAASSICGSRAWYDCHHWRRLIKIPYLAQSCVALFSKKAMCVCFDELVHIFLCSHAVLFCESATDKFVNFACGNCCHFLPRKLNKTIKFGLEAVGQITPVCISTFSVSQLWYHATQKYHFHSTSPTFSASRNLQKANYEIKI